MKAMKSTMKNNYIPIKLIMLGIIVTLGCERQEIPLPAATYPSSFLANTGEGLVCHS
jgi:hypothetical protein